MLFVLLWQRETLPAWFVTTDKPGMQEERMGMGRLAGALCHSDHAFTVQYVCVLTGQNYSVIDSPMDPHEYLTIH